MAELDLPEPGGDKGVWGTKLNTSITAVNEQVEDVDERVETLEEGPSGSVGVPPAEAQGFVYGVYHEQGQAHDNGIFATHVEFEVGDLWQPAGHPILDVNEDGDLVLTRAGEYAVVMEGGSARTTVDATVTVQLLVDAVAHYARNRKVVLLEDGPQGVLELAGRRLVQPGASQQWYDTPYLDYDAVAYTFDAGTVLGLEISVNPVGGGPVTYPIGHEFWGEIDLRVVRFLD